MCMVMETATRHKTGKSTMGGRKAARTDTAIMEAPMPQMPFTKPEINHVDKKIILVDSIQDNTFFCTGCQSVNFNFSKS